MSDSYFKLKTCDLIRAIDTLPKENPYSYPNPINKGLIKIVSVKMPNGPISIQRFKPGEDPNTAKVESISSGMLNRLCGAIEMNKPILLDRILGASYNTRSALEALLAHTPNFFICYPGRQERIDDKVKVKKGHKHLIWSPMSPHTNGELGEKTIKIVITEVDREVHYDEMRLPSIGNSKFELEQKQRHAQIQYLLLQSASTMGLKIWIAEKDHAIEYGGKKFIEFQSVIKKLENQAALSGYDNALSLAKDIDCIFFSEDGKKIPAIIEIEPSSDKKSGLSKLLQFNEYAPELSHMTYIIAAPDDIKDRISNDINSPLYKNLNIKFLPFSAIEELFLLSKRNLTGIDNIKFIHSFFEE